MSPAPLLRAPFRAAFVGSFLIGAHALKPLCRELFPSRFSAWRDCRVQIGGLAIQGPEAFRQQLSPTFQDYLTAVLNTSFGLEFESIPLNFNQNFEYVSGNRLDFIYSNPAAYTCMMVEFDIATVASLVNFRKGNALDRFAGVIFARHDSNISSIEDLREARVEAVSISGLGAMQLQQAELLSRGLNIMTDVRRLTFAYNQNKIVADVYEGYADVGFVRTDMIDRSVAKNKTRWEYFKVLNEINDTSFPFRRSTGFTPEWPIGSLPHVPSAVSAQVGFALMRLDRTSADPLLSEPGIKGSFATWVPPKNYLGLLGMLERIGYYDPQARRCLRSSDVYTAIRCPKGYAKQAAETVLAGSDCKPGYDCLSNPCIKLSDPELVLRAEEVHTEWNRKINSSAVAALTMFAPSCQRMSLCGDVAVGQRVTWTLLDQIGEATRRQINAELISSVEMQLHVEEEWVVLLRENITVDGLDTQKYTLNSTIAAAGTAVVQIRVNGQQAMMSPVTIHAVDPPQQPAPCPSGHWLEEDGTCAVCPAGSRGDLARSDRTGLLRAVCTPCERGTFQSLPGQSACLVCGLGSISSTKGSTACSDCPRGTSTLGKEGKSQCVPCPAGQAAGQEGSARCELCARGSFTAAAEGASSCEICGHGMTTAEQGSKSVSECRCPPSEFMPCAGGKDLRDCSLDLWPPPSTCSPCPVGMDCGGGAVPCPAAELGYSCPQGANRTASRRLAAPAAPTLVHAQPLLKPGYYSLPSRPLDVFHCRGEEACPGQSRLGEAPCSVHHGGTNCGTCEDGYYSAGGHATKCLPCGNVTGWVFLPLVLCFWLAFGGGLYAFHRLTHRRDPKVAPARASSTHTISRRASLGNSMGAVGAASGNRMSTVSGIGATFAQVLCVFSTLSVAWPETFAAVLQFFASLMLDVGIGSVRPSCLFGNSFTAHYLGHVLLPIGVWLLGGSWWLFYRATRRRFPAFSAERVLNALGMLTLTFFVAITSFTCSLFECYVNPNGAATLRRYPSVICGSSEQLVMLPAFVFACLAYFIGFVAFCIHLLVLAPLKYVRPQFRLLSSFLVFKYHPSAYRFSLLITMRSVAFALVTVFVPDRSFSQLWLILAILLISLVLHMYLRPFRDALSNWLETILLCILIGIMALSVRFIAPFDHSTDPVEDGSSIEKILLLAVFGYMVVLLLALLSSLLPVVFPKRYQEARKAKMEMAHRNLSLAAQLLLSNTVLTDAMLSEACEQDLAMLVGACDFICLELAGLTCSQARRLPMLASSVVPRDVTSVELLYRKSREDLLTSLCEGAVYMPVGPAVTYVAADKDAPTEASLSDRDVMSMSETSMNPFVETVVVVPPPGDPALMGEAVVHIRTFQSGDSAAKVQEEFSQRSSPARSQAQYVERVGTDPVLSLNTPAHALSRSFSRADTMC